MNELVKPGICPQCESANTRVNVFQEDGKSVVYASCESCGYRDNKLKGDDEALLIQLAKESFNTVYESSGANVMGLPSVESLAADMSKMITVICKANRDCVTCPMHAVKGKQDDITKEGGLASSSELKLKCSHQYQDDLKKFLKQTFPALPNSYDF